MFLHSLPFAYVFLRGDGFICGKIFGGSIKAQYPFFNQGAKEYISKKHLLVSAIKDKSGKVKIRNTVWFVQTRDKLKIGSFVVVEDIYGRALEVFKQ